MKPTSHQSNKQKAVLWWWSGKLMENDFEGKITMGVPLLQKEFTNRIEVYDLTQTLENKTLLGRLHIDVTPQSASSPLDSSIISTFHVLHSWSQSDLLTDSKDQLEGLSSAATTTGIGSIASASWLSISNTIVDIVFWTHGLVKTRFRFSPFEVQGTTYINLYWVML